MVPDALAGFAPRQGGLGSGQRLRSAWRWTLHSLALPALDILAAQIGILFALTALPALHDAGEAPLNWDLPLASALGAAMLACHRILGLYDTAGHGALERLRLRVIGAVVAPCVTVTILAAFSVAATPALPVIILACATAGAVGLLLEALVCPVLIRHGAWGSPALVVGSGPAAAGLAERLLRQPELGLRPIGFAADRISGEVAMPLANLGTVAEAARLHGSKAVAVVAMSGEVASGEIARLPFHRVIAVPESGNLPTLRVNFRSLGGDLGLEVSNLSQAVLQRRLKRVLELLITIPVFMVALPVIGVLVVLIKMISPGPAIYVQRRVGLHGRPVAVLKLRTMHTDAERLLADLLARDPAAREEWDRYMKLARDPRVLPGIGDFLRRSSLDELPQLWNVLRGDLSLIGPRPFPDYHVARFGSEFQQLRMSVKPGVTGLWQIAERSNADLRRQEALDTFYIQNWSLWLDLYIVLKTLPAVLCARGAR
ncbi:exopolysaccharide biosynthesis polyprenyl glycosylphosphotransferase [Falsiroseomonas tokyonensis]|uniref:Exopolysaccharide biosynthesis polyprenyl glycosylphosphotransferase n=1 Tax=Falsiroseomonas tokyonensis TaxID=430521 RepID=A0ABV7C4W1_9PROT|nr:exopolysaccharide biosynthesis polyprenyl glycosylphosphotransferase [Falsiroseomonas tokyonensis]MBU8541450.1 exopolysaccharide biosynthesis polyprenyl glycosylphosphotransferase [Falsiroseomonas tokyonensis]